MVAPLPPGARVVTRQATPRFVHLFAERREALAARLVAGRDAWPADVVVWVSWPKKAARRDTDISEDVIRELALPLGFVDVKVCAVSEVWSA